jgi:hypothetical protein
LCVFSRAGATALSESVACEAVAADYSHAHNRLGGDTALHVVVPPIQRSA